MELQPCSTLALLTHTIAPAGVQEQTITDQINHHFWVCPRTTVGEWAWQQLPAGCDLAMFAPALS